MLPLKKLTDDAATRGAKRNAYAQFARALRDQIRAQAVDASRGEHQRDRSECGEELRREKL